MTQKEWFSLPIAVRQQWWRDTDYGHRPPSQEMVDDIEGLLKRSLRADEKKVLIPVTA